MFYVKNMDCDRCINDLKEELYMAKNLWNNQLGQLRLNSNKVGELRKTFEILVKNGYKHNIET